ncbi:MAG: AsmA family protein [Wenzhouxiangella sp.]
MRRLSLVIVALIIMVGGFVASLAMLTDQDRLKQLLSAHAENHLGRQLQIEGNVSLRFFPRLRIEAGGVRLSGLDAFAERDLLDVDQVSAQIRLLPLISGRVETGEVELEGARLNLLFDETGEANFSGLLARHGREGAPGVMVNGPLRLENLALQIGAMGTRAVHHLAVERMELDGLAFDRALRLVFEGALGLPTMVDEVRVDGLLFVPAASGQFRLADMTMSGRVVGADERFELTGQLDFSAIAPLEMKLSKGVLTTASQELLVEGLYAAGQRPYFALDLATDSLDASVLAGALGWSGEENGLAMLAGWTAAHDYDLAVHAARLNLASWPLTDALVQVTASEGVARIEQASATLPGGTLELIGDLLVDAETSLLSAQARVEIDQLSSTLAWAGVALAGDGVGQVLIEPAGDEDPGVRVRGGLRFFDGRLDELVDLRRLLGAEPGAGFDVLEGQFAVHSDRLAFSRLVVSRGGENLVFGDLSLDGFQTVSGSAELIEDRVPRQRVVLSGTLAQPRFARVDQPLPAQ